MDLDEDDLDIFTAAVQKKWNAEAASLDKELFSYAPTINQVSSCLPSPRANLEENSSSNENNDRAGGNEKKCSQKGRKRFSSESTVTDHHLYDDEIMIMSEKVSVIDKDKCPWRRRKQFSGEDAALDDNSGEEVIIESIRINATNKRVKKVEDCFNVQLEGNLEHKVQNIIDQIDALKKNEMKHPNGAGSANDEGPTDASFQSVVIKVHFRDVHKLFVVDQNQPLQLLVNECAKTFSLDANKIKLSYLDQYELDLQASPAYFALDDSDELKLIYDDEEAIGVKNKISFKLQGSKSSRDVVTVHLLPKEPLFKALEVYAKKSEKPIEKLSLYFDGERVDLSETPRSLDLEGDELLDVHED